MLIGVLEFTVSFLTGHNFQRVFVELYYWYETFRSENISNLQKTWELDLKYV